MRHPGGVRECPAPGPMIAPPSVISSAPAHTRHDKASDKNTVEAMSVSGVFSPLIGYALLRSTLERMRVHVSN